MNLEACIEKRHAWLRIANVHSFVDRIGNLSGGKHIVFLPFVRGG